MHWLLCLLCPLVPVPELGRLICHAHSLYAGWFSSRVVAVFNASLVFVDVVVPVFESCSMIYVRCTDNTQHLHAACEVHNSSTLVQSPRLCVLLLLYLSNPRTTTKTAISTYCCCYYTAVPKGNYSMYVRQLKYSSAGVVHLV